jgi:lysophospholipase L1-like esterase
MLLIKSAAEGACILVIASVCLHRFVSAGRQHMNLLKWAVIGFVALPAASFAGDVVYVLGDSVGDGLAVTAGLRNLASVSVHIRGPKAVAQINQTPPGATAFIVLGTNDAEGSIRNIDKCIDDVVEAAERRRINLTWIGPHCVRRSWDARARELDEILRKRLSRTQVRYVSMRDPRFCAGHFLEPDGIHPTAGGYRYMWERARGSAAATAIAARDAAPAVDLAAPARDGDAGGAHSIIMEVHVPPPAPSAALVWERVGV